MINYWRKQTK